MEGYKKSIKSILRDCEINDFRMLIYDHMTIYGHLKSSYFADLNYILIGIVVYH